MKLTFGSLFSGVGGFDLGFERAGMDCRWQVEIDPFCQKVLANHWPDVTRYGDITTLDFTEVEPVDVLCGGFPCQPVSLAGKRQGQDDARWLWPEFARAIRVVRPHYAVMENVPGLLGLGMGDVLRDLSELGYDAEWQSIPAAAVGAPHLRDRVWVLAYSASQQRDGYRYFGVGDDLFPEGDNWIEIERREHRELVELVPGVHPRVATDWWTAQSRVARSAHGVSEELDTRNKTLGNAIVPQVAEWIGRRIVEASA